MIYLQIELSLPFIIENYFDKVQVCLKVIHFLVNFDGTAHLSCLYVTFFFSFSNKYRLQVIPEVGVIRCREIILPWLPNGILIVSSLTFDGIKTTDRSLC